MKILSGTFRGRVINRQTSPNLRPTTDKVRQAIFNTLRGLIEGKRVLDLFAGTGALGFEALSLGASGVVWVEQDRSQIAGIERTIQDLHLEAHGKIVPGDVLKVLERFSEDGEVFDFIFLDPPYKSGLGVSAVAQIAKTGLYDKHTIIVLETHVTEDPPQEFGKLTCIKTRVHGDTKVSFYRVG